MSHRILHGDCIEQMRGLDEASVDAIVCDPPYGLEFMGKEWDRFQTNGEAWSDKRTTSPDWNGRPQHRQSTAYPRATKKRCRTCGKQEFSGSPCRCDEPDWEVIASQPRQLRAYQAWCETWATEALRILKPGAHLLAFGGTRTYHRLACAIEDAGFEIRDSVIWLYGSGFPKSHNLNGDWQGWGTALKPAHEPIVVARKPLAGTVAANVQQHGTGALNVDGCRIEGAKPDTTRGAGGQNGRYGPIGAQGRIEDDGRGRWPANVTLSPEAAEELDRQSGERQAGARPKDNNVGFGGVYTEGTERAGVHRPERIEMDSGGASRFFYVAKASRAERNAGLDGFEEREHDERAHYRGLPDLRMEQEQARRAAANVHPTVKPIDLMRWLVRLVTPPEGTVLDPFLGSGTTGCAAVLEGFDFIGIEREAEYVEIAKARIAFWQQHAGRDVDEVLAVTNTSERAKRELKDAGQLDLLSTS